MTTLAHDEPRAVIGGVDTHKDDHVAAVIDDLGRILGVQSFPATRRGYRRLLGWLQAHGEIHAVGDEDRSPAGTAACDSTAPMARKYCSATVASEMRAYTMVIRGERCPSSAATASSDMPRLMHCVARVWRSWWGWTWPTPARRATAAT